MAESNSTSPLGEPQAERDEPEQSPEQQLLERIHQLELANQSLSERLEQAASEEHSSGEQPEEQQGGPPPQAVPEPGEAPLSSETSSTSLFGGSQPESYQQSNPSTVIEEVVHQAAEIHHHQGGGFQYQEAVSGGAYNYDFSAASGLHPQPPISSGPQTEGTISLAPGQQGYGAYSPGMQGPAGVSPGWSAPHLQAPPPPGGWSAPPPQSQGWQAPPQARQQSQGMPPPPGGWSAPPPQSQGWQAPPRARQQTHGAPPPQGGWSAPSPQSQGWQVPPQARQQSYGAPPPQGGWSAPSPQSQGWQGPPQAPQQHHQAPQQSQGVPAGYQGYNPQLPQGGVTIENFLQLSARQKSARDPDRLTKQALLDNPVKLHDWSTRFKHYARAQGLGGCMYDTALQYIGDPDVDDGLYRRLADKAAKFQEMYPDGEYRVAEIPYPSEPRHPVTGQRLPRPHHYPTFETMLRHVVEFMPKRYMDKIYIQWLNAVQKKGEDVQAFHLRLEQLKLVLQYAPQGSKKRVTEDDIYHRILWGLYDLRHGDGLREREEGKNLTLDQLVKLARKYEHKKELEAEYKNVGASTSAPPPSQKALLVAAFREYLPELRKELNLPGKKNEGKTTRSPGIPDPLWFDTDWPRFPLAGEVGSEQHNQAIVDHVGSQNVQEIVQRISAAGHFATAKNICNKYNNKNWKAIVPELRKAVPVSVLKEIYNHWLALTTGKPKRNQPKKQHQSS